MIGMNTTDFALLEFEGPDCATFLQGQLTCDINRATSGTAQLAACCDLKGRAVASFLVFKHAESHIGLYCPSDVLNTLHQHLGKYAVFSKVTLTPKPLASLIADAEPRDKASSRLPGKHHDIWLTPIDVNDAQAGAQFWNHWLLENGLCFVNQQLSGKLIPMMLDYEQLNGISFDKGCYLGQEVIARAHYRGQVKRHLYRAELNANTDITVGDTVTLSETQQACGVVTLCQRSDAQWQLLMVLQDKVVEQPLQIAGHPINLPSRISNP